MDSLIIVISLLAASIGLLAALLEFKKPSNRGRASRRKISGIERYIQSKSSILKQNESLSRRRDNLILFLLFMFPSISMIYIGFIEDEIVAIIIGVSGTLFFGFHSYIYLLSLIDK